MNENEGLHKDGSVEESTFDGVVCLDILPLFPSSEKYDLYSQVKRAAYSVPLNIVEGAGRKSD